MHLNIPLNAFDFLIKKIYNEKSVVHDDDYDGNQ